MAAPMVLKSAVSSVGLTVALKIFLFSTVGMVL